MSDDKRVPGSSGATEVQRRREARAKRAEAASSIPPSAAEVSERVRQMLDKGIRPSAADMSEYLMVEWAVEFIAEVLRIRREVGLSRASIEEIEEESRSWLPTLVHILNDAPSQTVLLAKRIRQVAELAEKERAYE